MLTGDGQQIAQVNGQIDRWIIMQKVVSEQPEVQKRAGAKNQQAIMG